MSEEFSRRWFLKYGSAAFLGLASTGGSKVYAQLKTGVSGDKIVANLQGYIPQLMQQARVPGAAVAVVREGRVLWAGGFGVKSRKTGERVTENTVFAAASLSKPVFAYAALKMCERGQLSLDLPLTNYTAKPYISDKRIQEVTTRMVLSHTAGFPNWSGDDPVWFDFNPGARFSYSSEGFIYLQSVVERLTKERFNDYMIRNVFAPLGMVNSSYVWRPAFESMAANGHDRGGTVYPLSRPKEAVSAGSLRTNVRDYAQFLIAMMEPGIYDSPFRLNEDSLAQMVRPNVGINSSLGWGLGWGVEQTPNGEFFWHWGDSGIYKSFALGSRMFQTGVVILTNSENGLKICQNIVKLALGGSHPAFDFEMIEY
ncbi:MAG TPA: serine hydrolase domain-containing protein [Halomicronema sp.]